MEEQLMNIVLNFGRFKDTYAEDYDLEEIITDYLEEFTDWTPQATLEKAKELIEQEWR